jgi:hypothetical protein
LIGGLHLKLPVKAVGNIRSLDRRLFVVVNHCRSSDVSSEDQCSGSRTSLGE